MFNHLSFSRIVSLSVLGATLLSCNKTTDTTPAQPYDKGIFVVNTGNFSDNNGSLSFLKRDSKTADLDVFYKENNRSLTGTINDYAEINGKGVILVDNSTVGQDKIEIVEAGTFKSVAVVGVGTVENPRQVAKATTNKAYVVCWDSYNPDYSYKVGYVAVLDLTTNKITKKITVQNGAESIIVVGNEAYIGNTSYSGQSVISVIDVTKDEVTQKITLPSNTSAADFAVDVNNKIWMALGTQVARLDPQTKKLEAQISITNDYIKETSQLVFNKAKTTLYLNYGYSDWTTGKKISDIYALSINSTTAQKLINRAYDAVGYDSDTDVILTSKIPSYKQSGYVYRHQTTGTLIDSVKVEIAPSGFFVK